MNPESWQRIKLLILEALDRPADERRAWLEESLSDRPEQLEQALVLLSRMQEAGHIGDDPARLGEFELIEELGRGGVGVVHRAHQSTLDREVAIKVLSPTAALDPRQVDRFGREARAAGKLNHPGIVPIYEVGEHGGINYLVMELVDGHDLSRELEHQQRADGPRCLMPLVRDRGYVPAVAILVRDAADALEHAHRMGIVHRDVKPQNLLLTAGGAVRLTDFGLARDEKDGRITVSGEVEGTPYYMSPEQAQGRRNQVDHRTDVYSLGVVLYELLTLRRPFEGGTSAQVISRIVTHDPEPLRKLAPRVPRDLALVCDKAMHKDPAQRYPSAAAFAQDLQRFLGHESVEARAPSTIERVRRHLRRYRVAYAAAALVVFGGLISASFVSRMVQGRVLRDLRGAVDTVEEHDQDLALLGEHLPDLRNQLLELRDHPSASSTDLRRTSNALSAIEDHAQALAAEGRTRIRSATPTESGSGVGLEARFPPRLAAALRRGQAAARVPGAPGGGGHRTLPAAPARHRLPRPPCGAAFRPGGCPGGPRAGPAR